MRQIFLDCDGVLADFDQEFLRMTGKTASAYEKQYGARAFWETIESSGNFFERLPVMKGAKELYEAVRHLRPIILTGCPRGTWSVPQKMKWRDTNFPGVPMVTCPSKDKVDYCHPGDILIDDMLKHSKKWIDGGGVFVHHKNTDETIEQLKKLYIL